MLSREVLEGYFAEGYDWEEYLLLVNKSANLHAKRYFEITNNELPLLKTRVGYKALIITEEACGDCAWAVPKLVRILEAVSTIEIKMFPRREFPELQDNYLTKGKRSVPKLVILDDNFSFVGEWGPRPAEIQQYVEASVGKIERTVWFAKVLAFYREEGQKVLLKEVSQLLRSI